MNLISLLPHFHNKIQYAFAVTATVHKITQAVDPVGFLNFDDFQQHFPERLAAAVNITYGKGSGH
jgi:hypothetical protein